MSLSIHNDVVTSVLTLTFKQLMEQWRWNPLMKIDCCSKESISHLLLLCPEYETEREIMRKRLFETCGISHLDLNLLLDAKQDDEFKDWRSYILENFADSPHTHINSFYAHQLIPRVSTCSNTWAQEDTCVTIWLIGLTMEIRKMMYSKRTIGRIEYALTGLLRWKTTFDNAFQHLKVQLTAPKPWSWALCYRWWEVYVDPAPRHIPMARFQNAEYRHQKQSGGYGFICSDKGERFFSLVNQKRQGNRLLAR